MLVGWFLGPAEPCVLYLQHCINQIFPRRPQFSYPKILPSSLKFPTDCPGVLRLLHWLFLSCSPGVRHILQTFTTLFRQMSVACSFCCPALSSGRTALPAPTQRTLDPRMTDTHIANIPSPTLSAPLICPLLSVLVTFLFNNPELPSA